MTANYRHTTVKLHPLKKTAIMNTKSNNILERAREIVKRERVTEGMSERTAVEKIYNYHIAYIENIIKS
jgi:hypothetical protein